MIKRHLKLHPFFRTTAGLQDNVSKAEDIYLNSLNEMYNYCKVRKLSHLWIFLYVNWYARDKWVLWSRSSKPNHVPRLRTTMMAEAHFRVLKVKFLKDCVKCRLDLLAHIITNDVELWYVDKLQRASAVVGYYPHPAWETRFNRTWKRLAERVEMNDFSGHPWLTDY
ncbi:hypothetical protein As57867_003559, partial [Aphanomyces stellatus]